MLTSLALMLLLGLLLGSFFTKINLPSLLGMLLTGIVLGPYLLNMIDDSILSISSDLRTLALVIILTRAGLALNIHDLKKVGRPAFLMCFVPACFEIVGVILLSTALLGVTVLEGAIMGAVVAAVSPAVVVPRSLKLMETGYGTNKNIPQLIMAGASVDDIFVIVLFTSFTTLAQGAKASAFSVVQIPISMVCGILSGIVVGLLLTWLFKKIHMRDSVKVLILLSLSFLLLALQNTLANIIPLSGLLGVMSIGATILIKHPPLANRLSCKFSKLWVGAEILLFVLVGATVDIRYAASAGMMAVLVILGAILFRAVGVFCCLAGTNLTTKERIFCILAYLPKATVQAAIGGIPLAMGLPCGKIVLTVAVLAILITAPLGAFAIDSTYKKLLTKE